MKFTFVLASLLSLGATLTINKDAPKPTLVAKQEFPDRLGDKNPETKEKTWTEYVATRKNVPNNCHLNERYNWYGNHRCVDSFEC